MKKYITIGLICLVVFVSLASLINNPNFSSIQNQNSQVHVKLTHQANHIFSQDCFNVSNSQYINTEGNDTIMLTTTGILIDDFSYTGVLNAAIWNETDTPSIANGTAAIVNESDTLTLSLEQYLYANLTFSVFQQQKALPLEVAFWVGWYVDASNYMVFYIDEDGVLALILTRFGMQESSEEEFSIANNTWNDFTLKWYNNGTDVLEFWLNDSLLWYDTGYYACNTSANIIIKSESTLQSTLYINTVTLNDYQFLAIGSYVSPIVDLGSDDPFCSDVRMVYAEPLDSALDASIRFSADNNTWSGFSDLPIGNYSMDTPIFRYFQFLINFTASTDFSDTPTFTLLQMDWNETVLNELPQLGTITVTFDNETLEATISVYVTDPDNDTMDVFLCLPLGDIVANETSAINGTIVSFILTCEYDHAYEYYLNVTDSEDSVQSSLFGFEVGVVLIHTATIDDIFIVIGACGFVAMIAALNFPKRRLK